MQSDPIGLAGGANTYNYVGFNPLNGTDPLRLVTKVLVVEPNETMGVGHVGIDINGTTYDLSPSKWHRADISNLMFTPAGYGKHSTQKFIDAYYDKHREKTHAYELNITPEQEAALLNYLNNASPQNYSGSSIGGDNCSTFVGNALQKYWNPEYIPQIFPSLENKRLNLIYHIGNLTGNQLIKNYKLYEKGYENK